MQGIIAVRALLGRTLQPAALLHPALHQPGPDHETDRLNALVAQVIAQAPADYTPAEVAIRCIKTLYRNQAIAYTDDSVATEVHQALRHMRTADDRTPYQLKTPHDAELLAARGYENTHLNLDAEDLQHLLSGLTLGDFSDGEYCHLITLTADAQAWVSAHLNAKGGTL